MGKTSSKRILTVTVRTMADDDADTSYLDQDEFTDRRDAYIAGRFGFIGIFARADIAIDGTIQTIRSGGLWGIQDDSDRAHLESVEKEELSELRNQLRAIGFSTRAISKAFEVLTHGN